MAQHLKIGKVGEQEAVKFLKKKNYKIIDQNFSCKIGEIDIIAYQKDTIVFVEVKTRKNNLFGTPGQAVNKSKQKKIIKTALYYLQLKINTMKILDLILLRYGLTKELRILILFPTLFQSN